MIKRRQLLYLASAPLLYGCVTTGPLFNGIQPPAAGRAIVYVYRPYAMAGSWVSQSVTINGEQETDLLLDGFVRLEASPGRVVIANTGWVVRHTITFDLSDQEVAFVRFTVSQRAFPGGKKGSQIDSPWMGFERVSYEGAMLELRESRQSDHGVR